MALARDRAILLKRYPFGESSLVVHLCAREHGRLHLIAKGIFRPTSRYFAALDLFDTLEVEWVNDPRRDLSNLRMASILRRRSGIPAHLDRYFAGASLLELADLASRPAQPDPGLFDLVERALDALEDGAAPADACLVAFELGFLHNLGLAPSLETCAACGGPAGPVDADEARSAFSAGAGGRLCRACAEEARSSGRRVGTMPIQVLADARRLLDRGPGAAAELGGERLDRVRDFAGRFLDYHLETQPRTHRAFLSVPNRNAPGAVSEAG